MIRAFSPCLTVSSRMIVRRLRPVPEGAEILVSAGDAVEATDPVARVELPGPTQILSVASSLGIPRKNLSGVMLVAEGDQVGAGQVIASTSALFGLLKSRVQAPFDGRIQSVSDVSGQVMISAAPRPIEVSAYLDGEVTSVKDGVGVEVEAEAALVQGIFGVGSEAIAELVRAGDDPEGKIVITEGRATLEAMERLRETGAVGLIAGSAGGADLVSLAGRELNLADTGDEDIGFTLVLTEGFGDLSMASRTAAVLDGLVGGRVSISGATQVRAGVVRPEIVGRAHGSSRAEDEEEGGIAEGTTVRIIRGKAFGRTGRVTQIPEEPAAIGSGGRSLVYVVRLDDGHEITVPRPNVEK